MINTEIQIQIQRSSTGRLTNVIEDYDNDDNDSEDNNDEDELTLEHKLTWWLFLFVPIKVIFDALPTALVELWWEDKTFSGLKMLWGFIWSFADDWYQLPTNCNQQNKSCLQYVKFVSSSDLGFIGRWVQQFKAFSCNSCRVHQPSAPFSHLWRFFEIAATLLVCENKGIWQIFMALNYLIKSKSRLPFWQSWPPPKPYCLSLVPGIL